MPRSSERRGLDALDINMSIPAQTTFENRLIIDPGSNPGGEGGQKRLMTTDPSCELENDTSQITIPKCAVNWQESPIPYYVDSTDDSQHASHGVHE